MHFYSCHFVHCLSFCIHWELWLFCYDDEFEGSVLKKFFLKSILCIVWPLIYTKKASLETCILWKMKEIFTTLLPVFTIGNSFSRNVPYILSMASNAKINPFSHFIPIPFYLLVLFVSSSQQTEAVTIRFDDTHQFGQLMAPPHLIPLCACK